MVESRIQKCVFMLVKFEFCKNMGYSFAVLTTTDFWVLT